MTAAIRIPITTTLATIIAIIAGIPIFLADPGISESRILEEKGFAQRSFLQIYSSGQLEQGVPRSNGSLPT